MDEAKKELTIHDAWIGQAFLVTLSRLYEKEDIGWTWYDGYHICAESMFAPLDDKYIKVLEVTWWKSSK